MVQRKFKNGEPIAHNMGDGPLTINFTLASDGIPVSHEPQTYHQALDMVLAEMREIMLDRQRKYGPTNILRGGVHGLIVRIGDKLARIEEDHKYCLFLSKGECVERELPDEDKLDAWLDLSNYAGPIAIMLQRGWWELPLEEDIDGS